MISGHPTLEQGWPEPSRDRGAPPVPGLLLVFSGSVPALAALPLLQGKLEINRGPVGAIQLTDGCLSRRHTEVTWQQSRWTVRDLGSRNGTYVDQVRVTTQWTGGAPQVLRAGDTLLLFLGDVNPYRGGVERRDGQVIGPTLRTAWRQIEEYGIFAEPVTIGLALAGHHAEMAPARKRLAAAREEIADGKIAGAVWT